MSPKDEPGTLAFTECCLRVLRAARNAKPGSTIQYAATYARAGLPMTDRHEIAVQSMYILNNLAAWRGDDARTTKATLKQFAAWKGGAK